jgi:hypothetical protein
MKSKRSQRQMLTPRLWFAVLSADIHPKGILEQTHEIPHANPSDALNELSNRINAEG